MSDQFPTVRAFWEKVYSTMGMFVRRMYPSMLATSALVPGIMLVVTLTAYFAGWSSRETLMAGILGGGLFGWLVLGLVAQWFATVDRANPAVYRELRSRVEILQTRQTQMAQSQKTSSDSRRSSAITEMAIYLEKVQTALHDGIGMGDWLQGFGYLKLWEQIHRAEENFILVAPPTIVASEAWYDEQRLQGCTIANRKVLLTQLQAAAAKLPCAADFSPPPANNSPSAAWTVGNESVAREVLRQVRRTINEFRDERRTGLVQARNQLLSTVTLTGLFTFLLLELVVLVVPRDGGLVHVVAGTVFYLTGAIMGLFNQVYLNASTVTEIEDYGLARARLWRTPHLSGLAALIGVFVMSLLSVLVDTPGVPSGDQTVEAPSLAAIFNLNERPFGLVLAVIFGLSPVVLISRLQQEAERYKTDLRSSEASSQDRAAPTTPS